MARLSLYQSLLETTSLEVAHRLLEVALGDLRRAGTQQWVSSSFPSLAWVRFLEGDTEGAAADLDEAWQIAERGPMRLNMADTHLHRARLFRDKEELKKARVMIERCGYWRRKEELEDAEAAAKNW